MKRNIFFWIISISIAFILLLLLHNVIKLEEKIEQEMFLASTNDILAITRNKAKQIEEILSASEDYVQSTKNSVDLQKSLEKQLQVMITSNIKYAFILYKDKKGTLRFLSDASKPSEKAFLGQKFDVHNPQWLNIFLHKTPKSIAHTIFQELSMTYMVPIFYKKEVSLILAIDFSIKKTQRIQTIITAMKKGIISIFGIILLALLIFIIQTLRYKAIKDSSFKDQLTGIYNRNYLEDLQRKIDLEQYVLAALDIDYFKKINDTYGHDAGDKVLQQLSSIMQNCIRTNEDILIRYGGEEFIILAKVQKDDRDNAIQVVKRIFDNIQNSIIYLNEEQSLNITVSIGLHVYPHCDENFSKAFKEADKALYQAKHSGRNQIVHVPPRI